MATADIRDLNSRAQPLLNAFQRRYPIAGDVGLVAGPEKPLRSAKETVMMVSPRYSGSCAKTFSDNRLIVVDRGDGVESSRHRGRTAWIGKNCDLFRREEELRAFSVVGNVAGGDLGTQPLTQLSLVETGLPGKLLRGCRTRLSQSRIDPETVAKYHKRAIHGSANVIYHLAEELVQCVGIW